MNKPESVWDGKLMHLGYPGIFSNTFFLFCSQNKRGVMHTDGLQNNLQGVANAVPTCITCIGTVPVAG